MLSRRKKPAPEVPPESSQPAAAERTSSWRRLPSFGRTRPIGTSNSKAAAEPPHTQQTTAHDADGSGRRASPPTARRPPLLDVHDAHDADTVSPRRLPQWRPGGHLSPASNGDFSSPLLGSASVDQQELRSTLQYSERYVYERDAVLQYLAGGRGGGGDSLLLPKQMLREAMTTAADTSAHEDAPSASAATVDASNASAVSAAAAVSAADVVGNTCVAAAAATGDSQPTPPLSPQTRRLRSAAAEAARWICVVSGVPLPPDAAAEGDAVALQAWLLSDAQPLTRLVKRLKACASGNGGSSDGGNGDGRSGDGRSGDTSGGSNDTRDTGDNRGSGGTAFSAAQLKARRMVAIGDYLSACRRLGVPEHDLFNSVALALSSPSP